MDDIRPDDSGCSARQTLDDFPDIEVVSTKTEIDSDYLLKDQTCQRNQHIRFGADDDKNLDYYDDDDYDYYDEEFYNYGDGIDNNLFEGAKSDIIDLIFATKRLNGRIQDDAEQYLFEVLSVCSLEQRKELMMVQNWKHCPLSLACEIGNLKVVRFLVEVCHADVDGFGGWPLYWAIIKEQKDIILYLIDHFADISTCLDKDYNLLMVALGISFGWSQVDPKEKSGNRIKKELTLCYYGATRNMDIVNILFNHGAVEKCSSVILFAILTYLLKDSEEQYLRIFLDRLPILDDIKNDKGMSVLEFALSKSNLYGCKMLTEHGANINACKSDIFRLESIPEDKDHDDISNNTEHVLESFLNQKETDESFASAKFIHPVVYAAHVGNAKLLYHLLSYSEISIEAKLDALELVGAYLVIKHNRLNDALLCWNSAIDIRLGKDVCIAVQYDPFEFDYALSVPYIVNLIADLFKKSKKEHLKKSVNRKSRRAFEHQLEFKSKTDLDILTPQNDLEILIQASLLYERLIGYGKKFTFGGFAILAKKYMQLNRIDSFVALTTYSLPYFVKFNENIPEKSSTFLVISMCKLMIMKDIQEIVNFDVKFVFLKCAFLICFKKHSSSIQVQFIDYMLFIVNKILEAEKTKDQDNSFRTFLRIVIKSDLRDAFKQTLLHHCVLIPTRDATSIDEDEQDFYNFHILTDWWKKGVNDPVRLTHLLLDVGANPNTVDIHGQTTLHTFFYFPNPYPPERRMILKALIEAGAHTDYQDHLGDTPITKSFGTSLQLCPVADRTLQCLSACAILKYKIPYSDQLTQHLVQFVSEHQKKGIVLCTSLISKYSYLY